ncbi:hypothetical protein A3D78_01490 [Candidatus Gottesmanbacteria bacterium RIFCSPHIGHO2_02_FULL_39_14]|uniref:Type 4 fimbrial biogenesis protein PilX N-terminal domain-containing protein n=1 Tax=Candidatus Gottesmanbacteria bacterium RIFCSPHIGHO2_02_FULL_39_14 TaxID=1798383 RepID=A0A1F5ZWG1_9BACT|nr:MAG: hypothetical protein A3D78_01490 [Candidatus Gottesmanbacteria bacterium RIFCSPHIGHO2_02_FULL_39_14]
MTIFQKIRGRFDRGQIVLILVLITVVGLTIGLSLISRTITDIRISSQIEQSSRAFSAAEAGIETALRGNIAVGPTGTVSLEGASANFAVQTLGGTSDNYNLPLTEAGNSQTVWLIEHSDDNTINESGESYPTNSIIEICFGSKSEVTEEKAPAILVSLYYKEAAEYKVAKKAFDPYEARDNGFDHADELGPYCGNFLYRKKIIAHQDGDSGTVDFDIQPSSTLLLMRIQPLYEATAITVDPERELPIQGKIISSIGQTSTGVARKIQVYQSYPVLPGLLDFTFFSEN